MTIASRLIAGVFGLPPARSYRIAVDINLPVPMKDGVILVADRWFPQVQGEDRLPMILIRTPYGRRESGLVARILAERGYQVLVQSSRGTFGSGGTWEPFRNERADGQATLAWIARQPWFGGRIATLGASYQGLSQWAIVGHPQDYLQAMVIVQSDSDPRSIIYPSGIFALETVLAWLSILENQEKSTLRVLANALWGDRSLRPAYRTLPLSDCDQAAFGRTIDYFQQWLAHRPEEPWWDEINFGRELASAPAILMVGGWYDLHLPGQLSNFCALQAANLKVRLVIGPWTHESLGITGPILRETFAWFDRLLRANQSRESDNQNQPGLHLYLMGSRKWIDLESWPPPADRQRWYLYGDASLAKSTPEAAPPRQYIYDPAKPTPSIGGGATIVGKTSGSRNQRERERRSDVLTYTTEILLNALTIVGPSSAAIYIRTDVKYLDLFVRLCDVTPQGKSLNVTDGIARLGPADFARSSDGSIEVLVPFWPIAYTFKAGHRLRLQVSSAAHPMYVRNLCTGEPMEDGTQTRKAVVQVLNDPDHPSGIEIPVVWL